MTQVSYIRLVIRQVPLRPERDQLNEHLHIVEIQQEFVQLRPSTLPSSLFSWLWLGVRAHKG